MFCIEIIVILILILFISKHSLCPRILEHGLLLFQQKENVLYRNNIRIWITIILGQRNVFYRNNSNPYSDIISIQTFSLSQNNRNNIRIWITIILGQRNVFYRNNSNPYSDIISIQTFSLSQNNSNPCSIILGQRECFLQK